MRYLLLFLCTLSSFASADICKFNGQWKSNEKMTLESMNKTGVISEKQRNLFKNDFFGKLTFVINCGEVTSSYDGVETTSKLEVVSENGREVTFRYFDDEGNESQNTVTYNEDFSCYHARVGQLQFNEFFCKVE